MKARVLLLFLLLGLAACVSHPPRCRDRLTPINRQVLATAVHP